MQLMRFISFGFLILLSANLCAAGDVALGKQKSTACIACHAADGNSVQAIWPKLAGQNEKYLLQQMKAFKQGKDGGRYNPSMTPQMQSLSVNDMENLAAYFASQSIKLGAAKKELVPLGQSVYRGGNLETNLVACSGCHGPNGLGNGEAAFPRLSGQYSEYIEKQLRDYRTGVRNNGTASIMQMISKKMSDDEMKAVANYAFGLH